MNKAMSDKFTVSPIHLFFILYVGIVDVGVMGFQRNLTQFAGYDAWISILIVGVSVHFLIYSVYRVMSKQKPAEAHLVAVNRRYFGKWLGGAANVAFVVHFIVGAFATFVTYMKFVQIWVFPSMNMLPVGVVFLLLVYYAVSGGFQTMTGLCFWATLSTILFFVPLTFLQLPYCHFRNLLPLLDHSPLEILQSSREMVLQFLGFEVLLVVYPFIQKPGKSQRWAQIASLASLALYLLLYIINCTYYSQGQMAHTMYPTLTGIAILELPLMQRLEYIILSIWVLKMAANIALFAWASCHSLKLQWKLNPRIALASILALIAVGNVFVHDTERIASFVHLYNATGIGVLYGYIPVLFVFSLFKKKHG